MNFFYGLNVWFIQYLHSIMVGWFSVVFLYIMNPDALKHIWGMSWYNLPERIASYFIFDT